MAISFQERFYQSNYYINLASDDLCNLFYKEILYYMILTHLQQILRLLRLQRVSDIHDTISTHFDLKFL